LAQKLSGLVVQGTVALASGSLGRWLARRPGIVAWQERLAGTVMIILGLRLLAGDSRAVGVR
jgi:threonine/homoserine/homoserine lactone efflux protein